ncbi:MAG: metalloregulator ArsR/SmtB family transcription factor [Anaerolineaceae bacterium]
MSSSIPENLLEHVAERFRVLGDATRLSILRLLLDQGPFNVGELVERLNTSQANASKHLRILHEARMVSREARGTAAYYSVADPTVTELCDVVCGRLREQVAEDARAFAVA